MAIAGLLLAWVGFQPVRATAATLGDGNLSGTYALEFNKFGTCPNLEVIVGVFTFDGAGGVSAVYSQYDSNKGGTGPRYKTGQTITGGTYTVNSNGTGIITFASTETVKFAFAIDSIDITTTLAQRVELINLTLASSSCAESGYAIKQ